MPDFIQVSTQVLHKKEEEWQSLCSRIEGAFQAGIGELKKAEENFLSEPVLEIMRASDKVLTEGEQIFGGLGRHIGKLSEIAAVYEAAEGENKNVFITD